MNHCHVGREVAFKLEIPVTSIFDPDKQLFTVHHQLLMIETGSRGEKFFTPIHRYSILTYQECENHGEPLHQRPGRLFCVVRPPQCGVYKLEVYAKIIQVIDHYKPARPFPESLSNVWGCFPVQCTDDENNSETLNNYGAKIRIVVENPRQGIFGIQWPRLPVLYDLVVKRMRPAVDIKIKHRQVQVTAKTTREAEPEDVLFVMEEEENEDYVTFTLRFLTFGEHAVDVYVDSGQRQGKRRLYEMCGQFLFDLRPRNDPSANVRSLNDVLSEPKSMK
ncbi:hypothetical protein D915_005422 [Fasciola hepatica]|uniref:Uncharacterized protein n=1 Tax=Fasciola hepatica TaxID=6192 RepID=A0A4E0S0T4_FASHE|nr:hypothetical protein D915_005422 [Fasciola hepatica]